MLPEDNGGLDFTRLPGETEKSWNARVEHYEQAGEKWPDHHRQFVSSCAALIAALGAHTAVSMAGLSADSQMVSTQAAGTLAKHLVITSLTRNPPRQCSAVLVPVRMRRARRASKGAVAIVRFADYVSEAAAASRSSMSGHALAL
jgi:hypothetical protein